MKQTLEKLYHYETMDRESACDALLQITSGYCNEAEIAGFMSIFQMRNITVEELMGFRDALMSTCIAMDTHGMETMDIVGTGGDGKNTFNISTTAALVVAGAGIKVTKHGNYSATSISGSSDVLQYLGYKCTADNKTLNRQLEQANICFLHAPLFHKAMKTVSVTRKNLGLRTIFNLLGPVSNPANPIHRTIGVNHISMIRLYQYLFQNLEQQYSIVTSLDGYDEISLTGAFKVVTHHKEQLFQPMDIGMELVPMADLSCGTSVKDAAGIMVNILEGKGTPSQSKVVIANSGFAIQCARPELNLSECLEMATDSIRSGQAYTTLKKLLNTES